MPSELDVDVGTPNALDMQSFGPRVAAVAVLLAAVGFLTGCRDSAENPIETPVGNPPISRSFLFGTRGIPDKEGQFVARTARADVLASLEAELSRPEAERTLHIHGPIERGDGGHNAPWSWHFVPDGWDMVEISIEVCDGTPRLVEDDVDAWVNDVGLFCPWGAYVQNEL